MGWMVILLSRVDIVCAGAFVMNSGFGRSKSFRLQKIWVVISCCLRNFCLSVTDLIVTVCDSSVEMEDMTVFSFPLSREAPLELIKTGWSVSVGCAPATMSR